ncbi:MFS transporter [Aeromicrobium alkaliterrae]|uniref:Major facilitator superfamily (MFS) profile domain-containing protein n=1 Tax=Aeromicrobium alkaliterrae TaxID=302168 RepID=A0ABN2K1S7_9ACTN
MNRVAWGALLANSVIVQAVTFLLRPASTYQAISLDVPGGALGAIGATFAIVPLLLAIPVGGLVDRLGEKRLMVGGAVLMIGASTVFLTAAESVAGLVVANALLGAAHLACVIGQQSLVANTAAPGQLDARFGYYTFMASLGQAAGPSLIAAVAGTSVQPDTRPIFILAAAMSSALLVTSLLVPLHRRSVDQRAEARGGLVALLRTPGLGRALTTSAIILSAVDLTLVYLPALGAERELTAATVGALLTVRAVFSMASRLLLGRLSAWLGRTRLMATSIVVTAGALLVCAVPLPPAVLFLVVALMGLGLGVGQPLTMSWLTEQAPPAQRGTALSLRLAGNRVGQVLIPTTLGVAAVGTGAPGVLAATGVAVGASGLLLRGFNIDTRPPDPD